MGATVFFEGANELATLTNTFTVSGVATDPTAISLTVATPTGTATTYTYALSQITRSGTGVYTKDLACSEPGVWQYVWTGTGAASDVIAGTWTVSSTGLQNLYCTPEMIKGRRGMTDTADDAEILGACRAVARWIDKRYCQRFFYRRTATIVVSAKNWYNLKIPDLVSVTSLKTDEDGDGVFETTWATTDYQLLPANAPNELEAEPYTEITAIASRTFPMAYSPNSRVDRVQIVGVWGWPVIPTPVVEAAKILVGDYMKLGAGAFGVVGYGEWGPMRARMSAPALEMLDAYRHPSAVVMMA